MIYKNHSSSFRDPSGNVFLDDENHVYRRINPIYFRQYNELSNSGFYQKLFKSQLLIPHSEISRSDNEIIIKPTLISFYTYPYEWSFSQYKHAALHTLKIQKLALENGFSLKDATAFNVTFHNSRPIFVDSLSFDFYIENEPWRAYKQFISHFFGPLVLVKYFGTEYLKSLKHNIDGFSIEDIAKILPFSSKFDPTVYTNIHLLAKYDKKFDGEKTKKNKSVKISKKNQLNIIESLYNYIKKIEINESSEWKEYYNVKNYSDDSFEFKKEILKKWISNTEGNKVVDFGGNDGTFSRIFQGKDLEFLVLDIDANAVDKNYKEVLYKKETSILPIVMDLLNPSPAIGFENKERFSFIDRLTKYQPDISFVLALIHHITLTGNIPFEMSASFFSTFSPYLIIEFPDREDSWVQFILESKHEFKSYFDHYTIENFENQYGKYYVVLDKVKISNSERTLFLLKRK
jgi:hypothetical protein